ncbi:retrovirus-related Pol polyprotein from transposon opus [Trichonephila clavipes]|nr:retrovirus-related Pol polyprotein from transposon opus [Trichonephila clavipes]
MLKEGSIIPIQSTYASPVVLCRKNNGLLLDNTEAYRFAVDCRKLNSITKYPRYPLPLIEDLLTNIPYTEIMSSLDLCSGYFELVVNPRNVVKTAFVTKQGTYAFTRMPFGLSGATPNFQKAIDMILKPVIGWFVSAYMNDVIISLPSFAHHVKNLREVFRLLQEAGLTLNEDKCKFGCDKLKYLGLVISKEGITTNEGKVKAIVEMRPPKNSKEVSKFLGMTQWGNCETDCLRNQWFESRNGLNRDDRRFDREYQSENRVQSENFSREGTIEKGIRAQILIEEVKKSRAQVITAQGATGRNVSIIGLNVWIREFVKPWMFHVLADLEYPCILGVDFISRSKIVLDFDRKALVISDSQIEKDLTKIRPYRYDRVKQSILDYHVEEMLKEDTIISIQSSYAPQVVLCRKINGLPPANPEAYRFIVGYRKLNAITSTPDIPCH